jgi:type III restriction enzyme
VVTGASATDGGAEVPAPKPVFTTEAEKQAARVVMDVIGKYEVKRDLVPTSSALLKPKCRRKSSRKWRSG